MMPPPFWPLTHERISLAYVKSHDFFWRIKPLFILISELEEVKLDALLCVLHLVKVG